MENIVFQENFFPKKKKNKHFFRTMRITTLLLFIGILSSYAGNTYSQNAKVSINKRNVQLGTILSEIEKQTNYLFVYSDQIETDKKVSVDADNQSVNLVLDGLFKNTDINYILEGSHIILTNKQINKDPEGMAITQQNLKDVKGNVRDKSGEPLIGVSVAIKGTTQGTMTDLDGNFTLKVAEGDILLISYVGYIAQEITVTNQTWLDIILVESDITLDAVVVTALGIRKEVKSLTYNVQEVKADELTGIKDANFVNSLAGKIAGVTINQSASGIGGSSRVIMRGTKSLFGENNALYVIDGVPILSMKNEQPDSFYESPDGGDSDPTSFLNTDDIESLSVLTGAAAAALYGSQGANGVILITTKRGEAGKLKINYSNSSQFMKPFVMPDFQNRYGSKDNGFNSWGAKLETPSSYDPEDFFQTAYTEINSLSASVGSEMNQTYVSLSHMGARGIIPNNDLNRFNVNIRNSTDLIKNKLSLDLAISYARQKDMNMMTQGQFHNPLLPLYLFPRGDDFDKYKVYERYNAERNFKTQFWPYGNQGLGMQNPYWITDREKFQNKTDRYSLTASLKYNVLDWLNVTGRIRMDNTENAYTRKIYASSDLMFASENGYYMNRKNTHKQIYTDLLVNIDRRFWDDQISFTSTLGASLMDFRGEMSGLEGFLSQVSNFFSLTNIDMSNAQTKPIQSNFHDQTQALFATVQLGYKSLVYLDLTARNEWASTLAFTDDGTSFFYPSVGLSGVMSDIFKMPTDILPFMKLRASYSEVGNAPQRFITRNSFGIANGILDQTPFKPANGLKPERTKAFEVGTNMRFWKDKINLDVTYYNSNTYNQLFRIETGASSRFGYLYINSGKVNNWGFEVALGYKDSFGPVDWSTNLTYTLNRNKIKEMVPEGTYDPSTGESMGRKSFVVSENGSYRMELHEGQPMGDIYVSTLRKDNNGYVHVDGESGAVSADSRNWIKAGNVNPKYNVGWSNTISYKGFDFSFLIDARVGGIGVSATQALMDRFGVSEASALARDEGGVLVNGGRLNPENYYAVVGGGDTGVLSEYIYSSTNVRLREASLGYTFPSKWFKGYIDQLSVSLIAKNLFMIYNKAPYDPETTASTGTYYQGFDYFMQPSLRSLGFSVKVQF
jgi:TonB-linked SusC/RagA family outer membrane protein